MKAPVSFVLFAWIFSSCLQEPDSSVDTAKPVALSPASIEWESADAGGILFVPVYSSIFHLDQKRTTDLSVTLSIYNTDRLHSITVFMVDYYSESGNLIKNFKTEAKELLPLETDHFVVEQQDTTGGTGAKILVGWKSDEVVSCPIVETVMIRASSNQGISFTARGVTISEKENSVVSCK